MHDQELADRVAANVRHLRAGRGITQAQAAAAAGLPRATWAHLESGAANPTLQVIHRAAQALQVSIEELIAAPRAAVELFKAGALPARERGAAVIRQLLPDPIPGVSLERIELPPRASFPGVPHTPGSKEYLACDRGSIVLAVAGRKLTLEAAREPGLVQCLARRNQRELRVAIVAAQLLSIEDVRRIEVPDLAAHLARHALGIERGDGAHSRLPADEPLPETLDVVSERRDCAHARDHDAPAGHVTNLPVRMVAAR